MSKRVLGIRLRGPVRRYGAGMLRDLAATARLPNLPTVWSNVLSGHLVGLGLVRIALDGTKVRPGFAWGTALAAAGAATFLYLMGTFLNDACDAGLDRVRRPGRPIPAGRLSAAFVCNLGLLWGMLGVACAFPLGPVPLALAGAVAVCVLLYTWWHKKWAGSVLMMGLCRGLLYPLGAFAGIAAICGELRLVAGWACALGVLQAGYVAGLSLAARSEASGGPSPRVRRWAVCLLALPFLAPTGYLLGSVATFGPPDQLDPGLAGWALASVAGLGWVWHAATGFGLSTGTFVARALAGTALLDVVPLLWFGAWSPWTTLLPVACFALALALQRLVPAT